MPSKLRLKSSASLQRLVASSKRASARSKRTAKPKKPVIYYAGSVEWRESGGVVELVMPIRLTNGNSGRTKHHGASTRFRRECESACRLWFHGRPRFETPVSIVVTRILAKGERLWDSDSILRGNAKEIIDSLVACGLFHNDSPEWITNTGTDQDATQRGEYSRVSVKITGAVSG